VKSLSKFLLFSITPLLLFISCKTSLVPAKAVYEDYQITAQQPKDSFLVALMKPYKDSVLKNMSEVVGVAKQPLLRKQPEGTLGNFVADAVLFEARQKFSVPIDMAVVNDDGLRIDRIAAGNVTKWDIFNVMPFENMMVVQKIKGDVLQLFLDLIAADKGWPVAGIRMQIQNGKAVNVWVGNKPLENDKLYTVVNSDYIANGGKNAFMLKSIPQQNMGYLIRDALFDYIKINDKKLVANLENRISNAQ
jgi:2',3'-cyclic-nucleotide 2'-phosphodiesterase (5'-nucleotidase family)